MNKYILIFGLSFLLIGCKESTNPRGASDLTEKNLSESELQKMKELKGYKLGQFMDGGIFKNITVGGLNGTLIVNTTPFKEVYEIKFISEKVVSGERNSRFHEGLRNRYNL